MLDDAGASTVRVRGHASRRNLDNLYRMRPELHELLRTGDGLFTRAQLLAVCDHNVLDRAVARGTIVRLLPRVYTTPALTLDSRIRARGALTFAGPEAALSHMSAAAIWRIRVPTDQLVHVLIPRNADHRTTKFVVVHRHPSTELPNSLLAYSAGLPAVRPAPTLVDCWAILDRGHRRDVVIAAVRDGRVSRDVRRDAALASVGWQVIRMTYARFTKDPADVRRALATIIAARRSQLTA